MSAKEREQKVLHRLIYKVDGKVCFAEWYAKGESLKSVATPSKGTYLFSGWSATNGAEFSSAEAESSSVICPASDFTVRAQFASAIKDLTVTSTEGGSVSPREGKMRLGVDNILDLLAVPDEGYVFSNWECSSADGRFSSVLLRVAYT